MTLVAERFEPLDLGPVPASEISDNFLLTTLRGLINTYSEVRSTTASPIIPILHAVVEQDGCHSGGAHNRARRYGPTRPGRFRREGPATGPDGSSSECGDGKNRRLWFMSTDNLSFQLVVVIVAGSMIAGAVDVLRQPGWAWKKAEESKPAYFVLVLLVPLIGLAMYGRIARPRVKTIAAAGRAASLPFESFGDDALRAQLEDDWPIESITAPERFTGLGATMIADGEIRLVGADIGLSRPGSGDGPLGGGGGSTLTATAPVATVRTYRPQQRTSLPISAPSVSQPAAVPAGWKADPTGRHQFRYWAGSTWTENVADDGEQSRDAVTS